MEFWPTLLTSAVTATVTLGGAYTTWRLKFRENAQAAEAKVLQLVTQAKADEHSQVVDNFKTMMTAYREDVISMRNEHRAEMANERSEFRTRTEEQRGEFLGQLTNLSKEFTDTLKEEREYHQKDADENREVLRQLASQNQDEHKAIIAMIREVEITINSRTK